MRSKTKTTATKEEATPTLVPKLRFPEFRGAEEWENAILGDLSEVVRGGSPRPIDGFLTTAADGLNWLKIGDVDKEAKYVTHTAEKVRPEALSKTRVVTPGDLILSNSMSFGRPYILQIKTCIHDGWIAITDIVKKAGRDFLYYSISAPSSQSYFVDNAAGSGVQNLNADIIKALPVCFPSPAEQQKIAECLSSVDELMAAQARKVDALKTHKKGLMQQLFPREGETQPRLRFPEFQNAGEWVEKPLGQLIEIASGQVDPKQPPYCDSPQIGSENIESQSGKLVNVKSAGEKGVISGNYAFDENDILYSKIRPALNKVAAPSFKGLCSADIYPIRPAGASLLRSYLFYLLLSQQFLDYAIRNSERGKIPKINRDALVTYKALIPSPDEQHRIADCLTSLDDLIAAQTQKHEALKTHKKGLMQQLFPAPTEHQHTSEGQRPGLFPPPEEVAG